MIVMQLVFHIISPDKFKKYQEQITSIYQKSVEVLGEGTPDEFYNNTSVYILCTKEQGEIVGGARLMPSRFLKSLVGSSSNSDLSIKDTPVWECNRVFFNSGLLKNIFTDSDFYKGLYFSLVSFSISHSLLSLITFNQVNVHQNIKKFGRWPFKSQANVFYKNREYVIATLSLENKYEKKARGTNLIINQYPIQPTETI
jgi:N-acyl-L-homoserine lactone synthetase